MPNIRSLDTPSLGLAPTETGVEAAAGAAGRIGGMYSALGSDTEALGAKTQQLGATKAAMWESLGRNVSSDISTVGDAVVKYETNQQISHGAAAFAKALADKDAQWAAIANQADPNDRTVGPKFQEALESDFDTLRQGFTTDQSKAFAEGAIERLRNHFADRTIVDMSTRARQAAEVNFQQTTNELSNAAINDPTSARTSLDLLKHSIDGMVDSMPNLQPADASRMRTELLFQSQSAVVKSAAIGAIARNPEQGLKDFSSSEWSKYISGAELQQLTQQAKTVQSAMRTDQTRQVALQKQQQQDQSDQREGQYISKLHDDDPTVSGQVTAKAIANDFTLTREARERMINIVNREVKPETDARVSAQTSVQIMRQLLDPNADQQKIRQTILEARTKDPGTAGSLTKADMSDLQKQVDDLKTPEGVALASDRNEFFKQYGPTIDPEMKLGNPTPLGAQGIYRAQKDARRQEQDLRARGVDPHSLYDPNSQYFLGKPERIGSYRPSLADKAAYEAQLKVDQNRPAPVAPGRSVNLTGNGSTVTGIQTVDIPAGMSPADAMKWAKEKGATKVRLPDGRIGTVQ